LEPLSGKITEKTLRPDQFGLKVHPLCGGWVRQWNAETLKALLTSGEVIPESLTPILHVLLMNTVIAGLADKHLTTLATRSITSGKVWGPPDFSGIWQE
jgi:anthranilate phosphoribosyltransferase